MDMENKGRGVHPKLNNHGKTHLSIEDVINIKRLCLEDHKTQRYVAKMYNIQPPAVHKIIAGINWKSIE
jgi:hypothetical protein